MNTIEEYRSFLAEVRKETGIEAFEADETGLVSLDIDGRYALNLQFVERTGKLLCFIELLQLPADPPAAVYRDLLAGGLFGQDTAGGYFALEKDTGTVVYNYFFDFDLIKNDPDEFTSTLEKILQLCDIWRERIQSGEAAQETESGAEVPDRHIIHV